MMREGRHFSSRPATASVSSPSKRLFSARNRPGYVPFPYMEMYSRTHRSPLTPRRASLTVPETTLGSVLHRIQRKVLDSENAYIHTSRPAPNQPIPLRKSLRRLSQPKLKPEEELVVTSVRLGSGRNSPREKKEATLGKTDWRELLSRTERAVRGRNKGKLSVDLLRMAVRNAFVSPRTASIRPIPSFVIRPEDSTSPPRREPADFQPDHPIQLQAKIQTPKYANSSKKLVKVALPRQPDTPGSYKAPKTAPARQTKVLARTKGMCMKDADSLTETLDEDFWEFPAKYVL